jgi:hypothetical protein
LIPLTFHWPWLSSTGQGRITSNPPEGGMEHQRTTTFYHQSHWSLSQPLGAGETQVW